MPVIDRVPNNQLRFGIVTSNIEVDPNDLPISLGDWELKRPTVDSEDFSEIDRQIEYYSRLGIAHEALSNMPQSPQKWTTSDWVPRRGASYRLDNDKSSWRFYTVTPVNQESPLLGQTISRALRISASDIKVDAWSYFDRDGLVKFGAMALRCGAELSHSIYKQHRRIELAEFADVSVLAQSLHDFEIQNVHNFAQLAAERFELFDDVREGTLKFLGYFSIHELLVSPGSGKISKRYRENLAARFVEQGLDENFFGKLY